MLTLNEIHCNRFGYAFDCVHYIGLFCHQQSKGKQRASHESKIRMLKKVDGRTNRRIHSQVEKGNNYQPFSFSLGVGAKPVNSSSLFAFYLLITFNSILRRNVMLFLYPWQLVYSVNPPLIPVILLLSVFLSFCYLTSFLLCISHSHCGSSSLS